MVHLQPYTDEDRWLTEALETDPTVMRELGGPVAREALRETHRRRVTDPWWFKIAVEPDERAVGAIGVWETRHASEDLYETGWMVLPTDQGRGIAGAALRLLIERVRAEPRFTSIHAFPAVTNAPSNALCRKAGFTRLGTDEFVFRGRTLTCRHWSLETPSRA
jgi:RimJ/RimL family protein N-acetyltransferase